MGIRQTSGIWWAHLRSAAVASALGVAGCVNPSEVVEQLVQYTPNSGRFLSDLDLTYELRHLDQLSYERFKVFYRGRSSRPEIIVLDIADDHYSFDARNWCRAEGGVAMTLVRDSIDAGKRVEAVIGADPHGRVLGFGVAVKDAEKETYTTSELRYVVRYQHYGRYEIVQVGSTSDRRNKDEESGATGGRNEGGG